MKWPEDEKWRANSMVAVTDALGNSTTTIYSTAATDANGNTATYTYDTLSRLVSQTDPLAGVTAYTYDAVGNRLTQDTQIGTTNYACDSANRLATVNGVAYTWDNNGNLLNDGTST